MGFNDFGNYHLNVSAKDFEYLLDLMIQPFDSLDKHMSQITIVVRNQSDSLLLCQLQLCAECLYHIIQYVNIFIVPVWLLGSFFGRRLFQGLMHCRFLLLPYRLINILQLVDHHFQRLPFPADYCSFHLRIYLHSQSF